MPSLERGSYQGSLYRRKCLCTQLYVLGMFVCVLITSLRRNQSIQLPAVAAHVTGLVCAAPSGRMLTLTTPQQASALIRVVICLYCFFIGGEEEEEMDVSAATTVTYVCT